MMTSSLRRLLPSGESGFFIHEPSWFPSRFRLAEWRTLLRKAQPISKAGEVEDANPFQNPTKRQKRRDTPNGEVA